MSLIILSLSSPAVFYLLLFAPWGCLSWGNRNMRLTFILMWNNFRLETQANVLWLPPDANYNIRKVILNKTPKLCISIYFQEWLDNNFRKDERLNFYIFLSDNILTPEALRSVCITVVFMLIFISLRCIEFIKWSMVSM